ncbi:MAG: type IV secretion system protein [Dongiaceae bacterium]
MAFKFNWKKKDEAANRVVSDKSPAPASPPDRMGPYPAQVHVPALESRRYLWTARAYAYALYLSLLLNVALVALLFVLTPLKRVEPMLVTFKPQSEQIVKIEPFEKGMRGFDLMTEKLVGEYVKMREEILDDDREMGERWSTYLYNRTKPEDFEIFRRDAQPLFQQFRARRLVRYVDLTVVNRNTATPNTYTVEYQTVDTDRTGREVQRLNWQASVSVDYVPRKVDYKEQYINPLGFQVQSYSTRQKLQ